MKTEINRSSKDGLWYFHIRSRNGQIVAQSEGYDRPAKAAKTLRSLFNHTDALLAQVDDALAKAKAEEKAGE